MKIGFASILSLILFSAPLWANNPSFLNPQSEQEYRDTLAHLKQMLPKVESNLVYSPLMRPFGLLDVHPTRFNTQDAKSEFTNFNLGVMGSMLGLSGKDVASLPDLILCKDQICIDRRIKSVVEFLALAESSLNLMAQSSEIFLVGHLSDTVYRINHTFVSTEQAYTYEATEKAGFIPSSVFTYYKTLSDAPGLPQQVEDTNTLRQFMKQFGVAAIVRSSVTTLNIIFNGVGDNHWGVVIGEAGLAVPSEGEFNHLGYKYNKLSPIENNAFYYQTD